MPDWLCLTQPRIRCRSRQAAPYAAHHDEKLAAVARGVLRHHADDNWFHQTAAFGDLSLELARQVRRVTGDADGMRPGFLGHILLELLLDAALIEDDARCGERYYAALGEVDVQLVAAAVSEMTGRGSGALATIITRFCQLKFVYDYLDNERLRFRLNQVMRRVRLPELPEQFVDILPQARRLVAAACQELLTPPPLLARRTA